MQFFPARSLLLATLILTLTACGKSSTEHPAPSSDLVVRIGASAPLKELQKKFGFTPERVVAAARDQLKIAGKA